MRMKFMRMKAPLTGIALLGCLFAGIATTQDTFAEVQSRVSEFTLSNGLKFIVLERRMAPVVSFYTYADVGSAQEVKGITGLAHMFEHLAFKGTTKIGTKNYSEERLALNGVDQAFLGLNAANHKPKGS